METRNYLFAKEAIMKTKILSACAMLTLAAAIWPVPSVAQDYPTKAVRIVVTFPPGGSSDVTARALSVPLQKALGQAVVVDNKPGGGGTIAASEIFARGARRLQSPDVEYDADLTGALHARSATLQFRQGFHSRRSGGDAVTDVVMAHSFGFGRGLAELMAFFNRPGRTRCLCGSGGAGRLDIGTFWAEGLGKRTGAEHQQVGYGAVAPIIRVRSRATQL